MRSRKKTAFPNTLDYLVSYYDPLRDNYVLREAIAQLDLLTTKGWGITTNYKAVLISHLHRCYMQ